MLKRAEKETSAAMRIHCGVHSQIAYLDNIKQGERIRLQLCRFNLPEKTDDIRVKIGLS